MSKFTFLSWNVRHFKSRTVLVNDRFREAGQFATASRLTVIDAAPMR